MRSMTASVNDSSNSSGKGNRRCPRKGRAALAASEGDDDEGLRPDHLRSCCECLL